MAYNYLLYTELISNQLYRSKCNIQEIIIQTSKSFQTVLDIFLLTAGKGIIYSCYWPLNRSMH